MELRLGPDDVQEQQQFAGGSWPAIVRETIQGAINTRLIAATDQIVSIYHRYGASCRSILWHWSAAGRWSTWTTPSVPTQLKLLAVSFQTSANPSQ